MNWTQLYDKNTQPTKAQISAFIQNPLWEQIHEFLQGGYQVQPTYTYSTCPAQPGWNVKYQKGGRSLCTLYPMPGFFIALVVIGNKEQTETELMLPMLSQSVQSLYKNAACAMGRWLMISVTDEEIFEDVKRLIQIRRKIK